MTDSVLSLFLVMADFFLFWTWWRCRAHKNGGAENASPRFNLAVLERYSRIRSRQAKLKVPEVKHCLAIDEK